MKKWFCILLAAMLLLLAACSGNPAPSENTVPSTTENPADTTPESDGGSSSIEDPDPPEDALTAEADGEATSQGGSDEEGATVPASGGVPAPSAPEPAANEDAQPVNAPQTDAPPPAAPQPDPETPRILIAYFTWADNTVVEDPGAVDVDASTSASVLVPGNAAKMAGWIQAKAGGDLFSIRVSEPYSSDYDECLDRAADEKAENARPALTSHVGNMEDYDIVFLGFPNWWYTVPMAILSFVEKYDFSGKTVVPFVTHGTGGLSSTIRDLTAALPDDVTVLEAIGVYRPEVDSSRSTVEAWVDGLNLDIG